MTLSRSLMIHRFLLSALGVEAGIKLINIGSKMLMPEIKKVLNDDDIKDLFNLLDGKEIAGLVLATYRDLRLK